MNGLFRTVREKLLTPVHDSLSSSESRLARKIEATQTLMGRLLAAQSRSAPNIDAAAFKVFSQFGEDGMIQYLISKVPIPERTFIEFGVEDYTEANTRFLLVNDDWRGLVMDSSESNIAAIRNSEIYWQHDLTAKPAFVTRENINSLIAEASFSGDVGLLSIDLDGMDYWIWQAITCISPRIVACEFQSLFGPHEALAVPYSPDFNRHMAHFSGVYWGASLSAFCDLAQKKGYSFVGCSAGLNAFFIRSDCANNIAILAAEEGYKRASFSDGRDQTGSLTCARGTDRLAPIKDCPVLDVRSGITKVLREIPSLWSTSQVRLCLFFVEPSHHCDDAIRCLMI
jgi:hypothetical protein